MKTLRKAADKKIEKLPNNSYLKPIYQRKHVTTWMLRQKSITQHWLFLCLNCNKMTYFSDLNGWNVVGYVEIFLVGEMVAGEYEN